MNNTMTALEYINNVIITPYYTEIQTIIRDVYSPSVYLPNARGDKGINFHFSIWYLTTVVGYNDEIRKRINADLLLNKISPSCRIQEHYKRLYVNTEVRLCSKDARPSMYEYYKEVLNTTILIPISREVIVNTTGEVLICNAIIVTEVSLIYELKGTNNIYYLDQNEVKTLLVHPVSESNPILIQDTSINEPMLIKNK